MRLYQVNSDSFMKEKNMKKVKNFYGSYGCHSLIISMSHDTTINLFVTIDIHSFKKFSSKFDLIIEIQGITRPSRVNSKVKSRTIQFHT